MIYKFHCKCCEMDTELDIPIDKYTELRDKQRCPFCKNKLQRVLEWTGIATGSGSGWFGRSDGSKAI